MAFFANFASKNYVFMKKNLFKYLISASFFILTGCSSYHITSISRTQVVVDSHYDANPDEEATAFLDPYKQKVDSMMSPVVGHLARTMSSDRPESLLSNLLSDILVWTAAQYGEKADFGVYNMGGIRASLPQGTVTFGDVLEVAPFENKICFLSLKGSDVKQLFREISAIGGEGVSHSVRLVITKDKKMAGLTIDGKEVDDNRTYRIATIDYLSEGNDRMPSFAKHFDLNSPAGKANDMRCIISDFFRIMDKKGVVVDAKIEGRVVVLN